MGNWRNPQRVEPRNYRCSYCENDVAPNLGYAAGPAIDGSGPIVRQISICHKCGCPTYITASNNQFPQASYGDTVQGIDSLEVQNLYNEARKSFSAGAYTASAMASRKVLMNIAASKGAVGNDIKNFKSSVDWLKNNHFTPPGSEDWVDHIRKKGNEANHEIRLMRKEDAEEALVFLSHLLKFIYEMPSRMKRANPNP